MNTMFRKRVSAAILFSCAALLLSGCDTVGLVPPADVGNGARLEGKVPASRTADNDWQSYDYYPPAPAPEYVAPAPGRVNSDTAVEKNELPAPEASLGNSTAGKYAGPSNSDLANKFSDHAKSKRWGVDDKAVKRSYSSRSLNNPSTSWIERNVSPENRTGFNKMVLEARRYGNSKFIAISGVGYESFRMDGGGQTCSKIKVSRFMANDDTPRSTTYLTQCVR